MRKWIAEGAKLAPYRVYLEETLRRKPHTLSAAEERVAAEAGEIERTGGEVHGVLSNADLPYPTVKLSTGESVRLDASAFTLHRQARVRADRDKVFAAFFGALKTYERTMGSTLAAAVKAHLFEKRVRHFDSALEAALFRDNIPTAVYKQLLADVHRSLPTLHRYLALRKRMLGLDNLRYQDLYVPLVASVDMRFAPDEARALTLDALAPLGKAYTDALQQGLREPLDRLPAVAGKALGRVLDGRLRRAPVSAAELQRTLRRPDDARARVGAFDAHVPVARRAALPDGGLPDLRRRGGVDVQREPADSLHARARQGRRHPAVPAGHVAGRAAHDAVPADAVRGLRAGASTNRPSAASR